MVNAANGTVAVTSWGRCDGDPRCRLWRVRKPSTHPHEYALMHETDALDAMAALERATWYLDTYPDVFVWIDDDDNDDVTP